MEKKIKIIAIIQIRLGSTRLPKKAMLKILDKPIIWHIYNRLKFCKNLDEIVIATGDSKNNLEIQDFAKKNNISIFEGNEIDLISRLYQTGEKFHASAIVRITGDSPLVDPTIVDQVISTYKKNIKKIDIVSNIREKSFPHGLEVEIFSMESLKKMNVKIKKPEIREWFPLFIEKNPTLFNILNISNSKDLSKLRWTLDYEEDYTFIKKIYEELYIENEIFLMNDILKLIHKNPKLQKINSKYIDHHNIGAPEI
jgi:spore coat polysaccharide biosynthesis protein SpsF